MNICHVGWTKSLVFGPIQIGFGYIAKSLIYRIGVSDDPFCKPTFNGEGVFNRIEPFYGGSGSENGNKVKW
jgi:hypothetical protein